MREIRRRQGVKKAEKVLRVWRKRWHPLNVDLSPDSDITQRMLHTRKPCSCPGCGNPRHHFGELTRQEKVALERESQWELF